MKKKGSFLKLSTILLLYTCTHQTLQVNIPIKALSSNKQTYLLIPFMNIFIHPLSLLGEVKHYTLLI